MLFALCEIVKLVVIGIGHLREVISCKIPNRASPLEMFLNAVIDTSHQIRLRVSCALKTVFSNE